MPDDYIEEREIVNRRGSEVFKHEKHEISEIYEKNFKSHAEFAKKWKAVMERPSGAELRIRRQANQTGYVNARKTSRGDAEVRRMYAKF